MKSMLSSLSTFAVLLFISSTASFASGEGEVAPPTTIGGFVAGGYQMEFLEDAEDHVDGGTVPFQFTIDHAASARDQFHALVGFASGKGLNAVTSFYLDPWAAYSEDDVKDINGRNRDYLLTAWYRRSFPVGDEGELALTGGIIDGTDYLDENAFANDEYTEFMNAALVNGPNFNAPSYDIGAALEFDSGPWSVRGAFMEVGENGEGRPYRYAGIQGGVRLEGGLGTGNVRLGYHDTNDAFSPVGGGDLVSKRGFHVSIDQELGPILGAWLRLGTQEDAAVIDHGSIYSGGLNFRGAGWGRPDDNVGAGYAKLDNGNFMYASSEVFEVYYRLGLSRQLACTFDAQYMRDRYTDDTEVKGWVLGIRLVAGFGGE